MSNKYEPQQIYDADAAIPSPFTKQVYRLAFRRFLRYLDMEGNQADLLQQNRKIIESQIIGYIHFLSETKHYNRYSLGTPLASIFHFYEMNDILLNKRKITRFIPADDSTMNSEHAATDGDRAYTHEEIGHIIQHSGDRGKVLVLLMTSTGMRMGAIAGLLIGHLTKIPQYSLYKILVYAASRKGRCYTFCTPECAAAIDSYLAYRKRFGDPLRPTDPLIREQFDITDKFAGQYPKPLRHRTIEFTISTILERSGVKTDEVARSHGFRKFAITQMIKSKIDYGTREYLVGHRVSRGLDVNYDRTTEEDRLAEYIKAIPLLTIDPNVTLREKVKELESEHLKTMDEYHDEWLNKLKQEYSLIPVSEWNALKNEINQIKELLPNDFDQFMKYRAQNKNIGLKVKYVSAIPDPEKKN